MKSSIWNFWANKYDRLWVQKHSLKPTRNYILSTISNMKSRDKVKILDLGCGPGELIEELNNKFDHLSITGIDFSEGMLEVSKRRNPKASHIKMDVADLHQLQDKFDVIICTHSLPYYKDPENVMKQLNRLLNNSGIVLIGFASGNSLYDKFILSFVKLTTGPANYPSNEAFQLIVSNSFKIDDLKIIKEKFYMPRIAIYTLRKVSI
ncbi:MAG: class I SAM-dependent methyltransferase [Sedimentibacter sp.]